MLINLLANRRLLLLEQERFREPPRAGFRTLEAPRFRYRQHQLLAHAAIRVVPVQDMLFAKIVIPLAKPNLFK
jgi:hypothetical protein